MQRRRFETITTFSLKDEANDLRKQAQGMPPSIRRDDLLRLAQQAETACQSINGSDRPAYERPRGDRKGSGAGRSHHQRQSASDASEVGRTLGLCRHSPR